MVSPRKRISVSYLARTELVLSEDEGFKWLGFDKCEHEYANAMSIPDNLTKAKSRGLKECIMRSSLRFLCCLLKPN